MLHYQSKSLYMNKAVPSVALLFVYLEAAHDVPVSVLTYQFTNTHLDNFFNMILIFFFFLEQFFKLNVYR